VGTRRQGDERGREEAVEREHEEGHAEEEEQPVSRPAPVTVEPVLRTSRTDTKSAEGAADR
jgi:hypothetical protein